MPGGPRWPWVRPMGCGSAPDCGRGRRGGASEAELVDRVAQELGPEGFKKAFAAGVGAQSTDAVASMSRTRSR